MSSYKIKLKKAGTNPLQRSHTWMFGPENDEYFPLEIGDRFHITGQPDDVLWIVESMEYGE